MTELGGLDPTVALPPTRVRLGAAEFDVAHIQLNAKGQDAYLVRDGFIGVADGSTPLDKSRGAIVAQFASDALAALAGRRHLSSQRQFAEAIRATGGGFDDQTTPTCGVGFVQARGAHLEAAALADVLVVIRHRDGSHTVLRDDRVAVFDARSAAAMAQHMTAGMTPEEARAQINDLLADQFHNHRNTPGGYWVFANDPAAAAEVTTAAVNLADVEAVLICSDGFARLADLFQILAGPEELLASAAGTPGLEVMGTQLRRLEVAADSMRDFPRTSRHDDATAIVIRRRAA